MTQELSFLDSIITSDKVQNVELLLFSNNVEKEDFLISAGTWTSLKERLSKVMYDGATNYQQLNQITKNGKVYVFTDGNSVIADDFLSLDQGDVIINTSPTANLKTLQLWEFLNRATVIDFSNSPENMLEGSPTVGGIVYLDGKPLTNVLINSSSGQSAITDSKGRFRFRGKVGDTLRIQGGQTSKRELIVENFDEDLNFFLDSNTVTLDEVVVTEKLLEEEEKVNLGYATMERKKAGFTVYDIPEERISEAETNITDVLQEVPGLQISAQSLLQDGSRSGGLSAARIRGRGSISFDPKVLVVVDGVPQQRSRTDSYAGVAISRNASYDHIDPQNIKSIQVLKGLAATNLFGTEGAGGVIMITTKSGNLNRTGNGKPVDRARLTNNIFEGKLITKKGQVNAPYLKGLKKAKNLKEAYALYTTQREQHLDDFQYFIDVADFFRTANTQLADKVLSNVMELSFGYEALRTLFMKYGTEGQYINALLVAQRMVKNYPNHSQSYLDEAIAQEKLGNYEIAAEILNGMVTGNLNGKIDFSPLNKVAGTALRNLANQRRVDLNLSKIDANYKNNLTYNALLRFDWASPQNEFVLKFVNPQKRFFDWEHSRVSDKKRIAEEIQNGYGTEQFEIVGGTTVGKWGIYITNLSVDRSKRPYWVKCTVDYNYGKPNQYSEERLIRLDPSEDKERLFFEFTAN